MIDSLILHQVMENTTLVDSILSFINVTFIPSVGVYSWIMFSLGFLLGCIFMVAVAEWKFKRHDLLNQFTTCPHGVPLTKKCDKCREWYKENYSKKEGWYVCKENAL